MSEKVELATIYAWSFIGTPYKWGGNDPMAGFDCSGFCIEVLKGVGLLSRSGDWTAQGLWDMFSSQNSDTPYEGCLVFWRGRTTSRIVHVEYCIDEELSLGASGGGSRTVTVQDAIEQDAYIKMRPFGSRSNIAGFRDPFSKMRTVA